jgi:hypothetical protein
VTDYVPWLADDDESFAYIVETPHVLDRDEWKLNEGEPAAGWFPEDVTYRLSRDHGSRVGDFVANASRLLLVSGRLRQFLEQHAPGSRIEFLPTRLRSAKGKLLEEPFFVANPIGSVACMDAGKSDVQWSPISKDQVFRFRRLVLDASKIPPDLNLFRLAEQTELILVRRELAQEILDSDFTGMMFIDLEEYGREWRGGDAA